MNKSTSVVILRDRYGRPWRGTDPDGSTSLDALKAHYHARCNTHWPHQSYTMVSADGYALCGFVANDPQYQPEVFTDTELRVRSGQFPQP